MQASKEKTFQRTSQTLGKRIPLFSNQVLEHLVQKSVSRPRIINKVRGKSTAKLAEITEKTSKTKLKLKGKQSKQPLPKKEKKGSLHKKDESGPKYLEAIRNSEAYKALQWRYLELKNEQFSARRQAKIEIGQLDHEIRNAEERGKNIQILKDNLIRQVNTLSRMHNELRLHNYELTCELCARRGYEERGYYNSVPYISDEEELDYEEMLELERQLGSVEVGYPPSIIEKLPFQQFKQEKEDEEKCCICCTQFEESDAVYTTKCSHTHHHECLQKWLKIKRICPLCRQEIVLT